ncbi:RpiB/LacA/LacB family sugar-phosphate isomerase [Candidatus Parcubacteria bacterium]|nr:MAG: RpiB/LacA/LacB family sugar-phosphate isomerase [Candidatus Parcubacteria bacterium]
MLIYLGADHRGYAIKEYLKAFLKNAGYPVSDMGNAVLDENDDYTDFASKVAERVSVDYDRSRGIVICGSGAGVIITANKYPHIRSAVALTPDQAYDLRNDDDVNILGISANYITPEIAQKIVVTWLQTPFANEARFRRRIEKLSQIEMKINRPEFGGFPYEHNPND